MSQMFMPSPSTTEPPSEYERTKYLITRYEAGKKLSLRELAYVARHYPEAAQEISKQERARRIISRWEGGERLTTRETAFLSRYYPETLTSMRSYEVEYAQQTRRQAMTTQRLGRTLGQLEFLAGEQHWDIHGADIEAWDIFFAGRRARRQAMRQVRTEQKKGQLEQFRIFRETGEPPEYIMAIREFEKAKYQQRISTEFYTGLGYPELAGKYLPFEIPGNYLVATIKETKQGLEIFFEPTEKPTKGLAETLASFEELPSLGIAPTPWYMEPITRPKEKHPERYFAGLIASVEAPVYTIGRLAGFETPEPPPTVSGGLIGKGLSLTPWFGPSTELERALEYGPEYAIGTIMGDVLVSIAVGKGIEKTVTLTVKGAKKVAPILKTGIQRTAITTKTRLIEPSLRFALGPERYMYYKTVALPTFHYVTLPRYAEIIKSALPTIAKPEWYISAKVAGKIAAGKARYAVSQLAWPSIEKPMWLLEAKALGKVAMGQARYAVGVMRQPITVSLTKPGWYFTTKALGKVTIGKVRYTISQVQLPTLPSITQPMWMLETKAFGKAIAGKISYRLVGVQLPQLMFEKPMWMLEMKALGKAQMGQMRYWFGIPAPTRGYSTMGQIYFAEDIFKTVKAPSLPKTGKTIQLIAPTVTKTTKSLTSTVATTIGVTTQISLKAVTPTEKKKQEQIEKIPSLIAWTGEPFPFVETMPWGETKLQQYPKREVKMPTYPEITLPQVEKIITPSKAKIDITPRIDITPKIEPFLATAPFQELRIKQAQAQKQLEKGKMTLQFEWPRPKRKKKRDYGEEWFKRTHAILTPKELEKKLSFRFTMPKGKRKKRKSWEPKIPKIRF